MASAVTTRVTQLSTLAALRTSSALVRVTQAVGLIALRTSSADARVTQAVGLAAIKSAMDLRVTQSVCLVALKVGGGDRRLRAWTFTQDDHDFYVLKLGINRSLVLDLSTNQWSSWSSPDMDIWRAHNGMVWEKDNIAGDVTDGIVWTLDAEDRDDDDSSGVAGNRSPIQSIVRGLHPMRLRNALGCFRATLTASQGEPVKAGVGVQLRTSDDFGANWIDHGLLVLDIAGKTDYDISWPSIGLVTAPGKIFEITDTGYSRRIDGLDIDLGADEGSQAAAPKNG